MDNHIENEFLRLRRGSHDTKIERVKEFTDLTIPRLFPAADYENQNLPEPYESIPGKGCVQLASKISNALIPLNGIPFFSLDLGIPDLEDRIPDQEEERIMSDLRGLERYLHERLWSTNIREALFHCALHLVVVGDVCLHITDNWEFYFYPLSQYVVERDRYGKPNKGIIMEYVNSDAIEPELAGINNGMARSSIPQNLGSMTQGSKIEPHYTKIQWNYSKQEWDITKEFRGVQYSEYSSQLSPYLFLVWNRMGCENYGRSYVEENIGSIRTLHGLAEAFIKLSAVAAKILPYVDPVGITNVQDLVDADDLEFVSARQQDVGFLQANPVPQMEIIFNALTEKRQEIRQAFLMDTATALQGERVTATQVQAALQEMERTLGGVFTNILRDFQLPLILYSITLFAEEGLLTPEILAVLGSGFVNIKIKTGLDSIGREMETNKLQAMLQMFSNIPEMVQVFDLQSLARRVIENMGVDSKGIVKSQEQIEQERQLAMQQQLAMQAGQAGINAAASAAGNMMG